LDHTTLKMKALDSFTVSGTARPMMQHCIPEYWNPQHEILRSCSLCVMLSYIMLSFMLQDIFT